MNEKPTRTSVRKGTLAVAIGAAALAAGAGFAAVYVTLAPTGNRAVAPESGPPPQAQAPQAQAPAAERPPSEGDGADSPLAGLNRGEMAAFVIRSEPQAVADVAFDDGDGDSKSLSDWRGEVVLLNLWATWCAPCREEMPALDRLQAALGGADFEVVAVSLDLGGADKPRAFLEEIGIEHLPLYHDPTARLGQQLQAIGMPTTLLLDREGREIGRLAGPAEWDAEEAQTLIRAAIAAGD